MQAPLGELFPWIVGLWLLDGLAQLGRGHLLVTGWPGRTRLVGAGLHLVGLSPFEEAIAAHDLPFLASGGRVWLFPPRRRTEPALVSAEDLEPVDAASLPPVEREGRKVRAAGRLALVAPTPPWADRLRGDLARLAPTGGEPAPPRVNADPLAEALRLRARQRRFDLPLRTLAALLFADVFLAWPAAAYAPGGAGIPAGALLASIGVLVLAVAGVAGAMLAACGEGPARSLAGALHLALYPVAALRPLAHAPRSLYRAFDGPTLAAALLPRAEFARFAAREIRRARLSRAATSPELAGAWDERERVLTGLLAATGTAVQEALAPPQAAPGAAAWCPLCASQYVRESARCGDCGVDLVPFEPA